MYMYIVPELKKPYANYEPYIDEATMKFHHQAHHSGYVEKLNRALVENNFDINRIEEIFEKIADMPAIIRNNAGGHYNHTVFWSTLNDTMSVPSSELNELINKKYGLLDDFKAEFIKKALSLFGSGWTWLVITELGELDIINTKNQDNPLMADVSGGYPLLGIDIWEHAYYLKHQNRRVEYLNSIWSLIDWDEVSMRLSNRPEMNELV